MAIGTGRVLISSGTIHLPLGRPRSSGSSSQSSARGSRMNRRTSSRRRGGVLHAAGWLAAGSMIAVALLAPATASAATIWATPDRNQADFWGDNCTKLPEGNLGSTFVLDHDYDLVIVKAGSDQSVPDGP